jgi:hypothetical protein
MHVLAGLHPIQQAEVAAMTAYSCARGFGRGRLFSAWLQLRFWFTGRTGEYRIARRGIVERTALVKRERSNEKNPASVFRREGIDP